MFQSQAEVLSNSEVVPGMYLLWAEAPEIAGKAAPGQFVTVRCAEGLDPLLRRPISIHRIDRHHIALLFALVGRGTEWLSRQRDGDSLDMIGPLGHGFTIMPESKRLLLVAGGVGIAPLIALAESALLKGLQVTLVLGARSASMLYPEVPAGVTLITTTEDGSAGIKGRASDVIAEYLRGADQVFACGPLPMYQTLARMKPRLPPVKSFQVLLEQRMGCGIGACYGCTITTADGLKLVCKDGPVFELDRVHWKEITPP